MKPLKNTIVLITILVIVFCVTQSGHAANTGSTHAIEGLLGAKYSGAPSQTLAGRMGLLFEDLKDTRDIVFSGKISDPEPLKKLGYEDFKIGDEIQMTRTDDNTWKIKHVKSEKEFILKVSS
ncbi:hypothetical protein K8T06_09215 [bacterium]|nr:hypothetical protein [bacterium]